MKTIYDTTLLARKVHHDNTAEWLLNSDLRGALTFSERRSIIMAARRKWKILPGMPYRKQINIDDDGQIYTFKAIQYMREAWGLGWPLELPKHHPTLHPVAPGRKSLQQPRYPFGSEFHHRPTPILPKTIIIPLCRVDVAALIAGKIGPNVGPNILEEITPGRGRVHVLCRFLHGAKITADVNIYEIL